MVRGKAYALRLTGGLALLYLTAAVMLVGFIGLLNLLLTFGVIRRLREHDTALASRPSMPGPDIMVPAGTEVSDFETQTVDGTPVSNADFTGHTVVGFFSTTCEPCRDRLPEFVTHAATVPGGRDRVLAVVVSDSVDADPSVADLFVAQLGPVARVVTEQYDGPIGKAFGVQGYPALAAVVNGTVVAAGNSLNDLAAAAPTT
jgi:cytochrome oxidase Cu insertion factor (SCO1/SenC/PrrC family)